MTIKKLVTSTNMDHFEFQNPLNKPVEELKIKYLAHNNSYEELVPALNSKWCNKEYVFTLYVPPPHKNLHGEFTMGSKEDWLERMSLFIGDVNMLLQLDYHRFWSEVVYNSSSLDGLSSFLQNAPPFYLRDQIPQDKDILRMLKKAHESVFLLLERLTRSRESEKTWMMNNTLGNILYNNFVISLPQLMEISLIYASDNFKAVTELITRVIDIQSKYVIDIERSTSFISEVFSKFENQLMSGMEEDKGASLLANSTKTTTSEEIVKLIFLMLDISYSIATFLEVCSRAAKVFHEQQLEPRIASFYENTIPVINKHLDTIFNNEETREQHNNLQLKVNLSRHQLLSAVHQCLANYLSTILDDRSKLDDQELRNRIDSYINTVSECLSDHIFIHDYNSAFPVQRELRVLSEIFPDLDSSKSDFIVESILSLYDLPHKPKKPLSVTSAEPGPSTSYFNDQMPQQSSEEFPKKISGVELESLITEVKDILPHLGDGFIAKCLEHYNYESADVINAILENTIPDSLSRLDLDLPLIPPEDSEEDSVIPQRINVYDNDEFDIMTQDKVDTSKIHRGKRQDKHKNIIEMLNDKSHVNQLRDVYTKLSLVECLENVNDYEDEYDDTYDDVDASVTNEGETEVEERRGFVVPRVLLQQRKATEELAENGEEEEEENNEETTADLFIENPADIRARAEQRRQEMRGRSRGRSRAAFTRNVVGNPRGQGQDKEVIMSREFKNNNKASRGNHNRRSMAAKKRRQGMLPT